MAQYGERPAVSSAVAVAVTALIGFAVTCWLALFTARGQQYDETARQVLASTSSDTNTQLVELLQRISVVSAGIALAALLVVALVRGRLRVALAAAVLVAGANVSTELLKHYVLDRPDLGVGTTSNSLPSGHTTVVFSLVLAAVLVAPRALRWLVALAGAGVGALAGLATVIAGWHRPADVIAAMLVTVIWAAVVSAVVAGRPRDGRLGHSGIFPALLGAAVAAIGLIVDGFGWSSSADASKVIPFTAAVVAAVAGIGVGGYSRLVSRTSN
jgi:membrane-associated phospholipid phosphatase